MSLLGNKHADEIREMWQSRCLLESAGRLRKVMTVAIAKEYPGALLTLMQVSFPGFVDLDKPLFVSYAAITKFGKITCFVIGKDGFRRRIVVYETEAEFIKDVRMLADRLKLSDKDRSEMFIVLQKWVASDKRVDHEGRKLAS